MALARGVTFSFWQPVRLALMPNLVPRSEISTAIALNSSTFNAAQFVGPALAGGSSCHWAVPELAFCLQRIRAPR